MPNAELSKRTGGRGGGTRGEGEENAGRTNGPPRARVGVRYLDSPRCYWTVIPASLVMWVNRSNSVRAKAFVSSGVR